MSYLEIQDQAGKRWVPVGDYFTIGRSVQNHVVLYGTAVSRNHARIVFQARRAVVEDLGSTYGTLVNGEYVQNWHTLQNGDQIRLGDALITFHMRQDGGRHAAVTPAHGTPVVAPNMTRCPHCGTLNLKSNSICFHCGSALWLPKQSVREPVRTAPSRGSPGRSHASNGSRVRRRTSASNWLITLLVALSIVLLSLMSMLIGLLIASGSLTNLLSRGAM